MRIVLFLLTLHTLSNYVNSLPLEDTTQVEQTGPSFPSDNRAEPGIPSDTPQTRRGPQVGNPSDSAPGPQAGRKRATREFRSAPQNRPTGPAAPTDNKDGEVHASHGDDDEVPASDNNGDGAHASDINDDETQASDINDDETHAADINDDEAHAADFDLGGFLGGALPNFVGGFSNLGGGILRGIFGPGALGPLLNGIGHTLPAQPFSGGGGGSFIPPGMFGGGGGGAPQQPQGNFGGGGGGAPQQPQDNFGGGGGAPQQPQGSFGGGGGGAPQQPQGNFGGGGGGAPQPGASDPGNPDNVLGSLLG